MKKWIKDNKMYLMIGVIILIVFGFYFFTMDKEQPDNSIETDWSGAEQVISERGDEVKQEENPTKIMVDVKGAVLTPGVYEADEGERVIDIIKKAGGLLDSADQNNINFAMKVTDEMVVYVPKIGEKMENMINPVVSSPQSSSNELNEKININSATESDLQTLNGIGPSKAAAIIEYRNTNGLFKTIEELKEISGIGDKTFEKLKDHIVVK